MLKIPEIIVATTVLLACATAQAQDYWLAAEPAQLADGGAVDLRLYAGHEFEQQVEKPYQRARVERLDEVQAGAHHDLGPPAEEGATPYARALLTSPGLHVIALDRSPAQAELTFAEFRRYLKEEGLDGVLQQDLSDANLAGPVRERYRRYTKAYVQVGSTTDPAEVVVSGQKLEIIPAINPYAIKPGQALPLSLRFDGQPLAQTLLTAYARMPGGKMVMQQVVTDAAGTAIIDLHSAGHWLLRAIHLQRAAIDDEQADWDSYWATCSFTLP